MSHHLDNPLHTLLLLEKDARQFGFDWPHQASILEQIVSECQEIQEALLNHEPSSRIQEEIGDLLHGAISLCLFSGYDVEETLCKVNEKFASRMNALKTIAKNKGLENLQGNSFEEMLKLWEEAKQLLKTTSTHSITSIER